MYAKLAAEVLPELIPSHSRIMAAVSGGPDSVAMAHILWRYINDQQEQGLSLTVNHVHHGARKESDQEELMVRKMAEDWKIPIIVHGFKAEEYAQQKNMSFQEAAREWRYARWHQDMQENNYNLLATAHHLDDQAETVIYRLLRGSGTAGLAGIYPAREGTIRPLLSIRKDEILAYCKKENLNYAVDRTNLEAKYDRNRIRLEIVPQLEKFNPRIQETLGRTAELLRWDEDFINEYVHKKWNEYCLFQNDLEVCLSFQAWEEKEAVLSRLLRIAASIVSGDPRGLEYKFIKLLLKEGKKIGWSQHLPGMKVEVRKNGFYIFRGELEKVHILECETSKDHYEIPIKKESWQYIPGGRYKIGLFKELPKETQVMYSTTIDEKKLADWQAPLVYRTRREGDKMYFRGIGHKSIKKVFQENNIPPETRIFTPLIAVGKDVIWIPGIIRSDSCCPVQSNVSTKSMIAISNNLNSL